ncbi:hypothetical protein CANCADRAFT_3656 [Tortispora caseinolytica NRRL Y-17796]|uniref:Elongator complex protein 4 n=1 Tax=Tortispora caseinolytica NRRL Y-17796 TaxID=767744 RepID=A0A1E4TBA3_9ASCO|nr:hypothetical protein CANCADRAFT_3656 [Tortispora caseinolytica NRRL Y-17796]
MGFQKSNAPVAIGRGPSRSQLPSNFSVARKDAVVSDLPVRSSPRTAHKCISTGSASFDLLLGHSGLPLGSIVFIEEEGNTDFASVLLRSNATQGCLDPHTKVLVFGVPKTWTSDLPAEKPSADQQEHPTRSMTAQDMRIAWRYQALAATNVDASSNTSLVRRLDLSKKLDPSKIRGSLTTSSTTQSETMLNEICKMVAENPGNIIRVLIPQFLNPALYSSTFRQPQEYIISFLLKLREFCNKYKEQLTIMFTISLSLYPRDSSLTSWIERMSDAVVHIEPFKSRANDAVVSQTKFQGIINVYRLPILSSRGSMEESIYEHAFRISRSGFEIEEWSIPVDVEANDADSSGKSTSLDY